MKRYGYIYERICDKDNIRLAIQKAANRKRNRHDVRKVLSDEERYVDLLHEMLIKETYVFSNYTTGTVREGAAQKERKIFKPRFYPDQILHWAMMLQLSPVLKNGMYEITCGSIPGRGVHYGKRFVRKWIKTDRKNTKYYLKMDVSKFYPSVDLELLMQKIKRKIKDEKVLRMVDRILAKGSGLPIGILVSQWLANFYLQDLDHYIKQELKGTYYVRYMDDMVVFGRSKHQLHHTRKAITDYLNTEKLILKKNWQVCRLDKEALDFMGFRFFRCKTILRKSIMLRITRKARAIKKKPKVSSRDAAGIISYLGWVKHSDSHILFEKRIRPYINIRMLKGIIRKESRCRNEKANQQFSPRNSMPHQARRQCISEKIS